MELQEMKEEKYLRVISLNNLKWSKQCAVAAAKAMQVKGMIRRMFGQLDKILFQALYGTYVWPRTEYCVQVWAPYQLMDIQCLENVQKRATKLIKGMSKYEYSTRLRILGFTRYKDEEKEDMIETYKLLNKMENVASDQFFEMASTNYLRTPV